MITRQQRDDIFTACGATYGRAVLGYFMRVFLPWVMFIPMFVMAKFTVPALIVTIIGIKIANRTLEHMFHSEFAALYSTRHFNLQSRGK